MRVLVTGSEGFVGRHLLPRLAAAGHAASGRDRDLDVTDPAALAAAIAALAPDAVIHLAAQASVAAAAADAGQTFRVNVHGTRCVLEAVSRCAPRARVLWVGSGEVYGRARPGEPPFREDAPQAPGSAYASSKACADALAGEYAARGLDVVRVRPFSHTGPGQSETYVLPSFARQAAEIAAGVREPRIQVGNLDSVRDFLDVEDVVGAYLRLLDPRVPAGVYNLASGVGRRIGDVLDALLARAAIAPAIEIDPARFRPTDCGVGDATRLRRASGWTPQVPFDVTLERVWRDWRERIRA